MRTGLPIRLFSNLLGVMIPVMLAACSSPTDQAPVPLTVHATSAAYPWLREVFQCVPSSAAIVLSEDPEAEVVLRLAEPENLTTLAYQVGTEDLLVITHLQVGVGALTPLQVEALFTGQYINWKAVGGADLPVQVWAFAPAVDIQTYFERMILRGRPVSSLARLAVSSQDMSESVGANPGSIGLLSRRWKAGNTRDVLTISSVPVLALVREAPQGALASLLACLQAKP
jgi:hypothetical protein